jgi:SAM-dependent methyltransferase
MSSGLPGSLRLPRRSDAKDFSRRRHPMADNRSRLSRDSSLAFSQMPSRFPKTLEFVLGARDSALRLSSHLPGDHITCNFCGQRFVKIGTDHSEGLHCPKCGAIARERTVYAAILEQYGDLADREIIAGNPTLSELRLLEFSPRNNEVRRQIYERSFRTYVASDFDLSAHAGDIRIDLSDRASVEEIATKFDVIILSHVLEHIPDYAAAIANLPLLLAPGGSVFFQVPFLEGGYTKVTWDEFHGDNTRVYHRFGFDVADDLLGVFPAVTVYVGLLDFELTSQEVAKTKYDQLRAGAFGCRIVEFGRDAMRELGLGSPDLCEVIMLSMGDPNSR